MITIDRERGVVTVDGRTLALDSAEAFAVVSDAWIDTAFRVKHPYTFTWLGRPLIQFADDVMRIQELIIAVQPDVIVETGVAHGGSLIFYASLCKLLGRGRVVGIDIEIRPHNRAAIEAHPLAPYVTLIEGNSIEEATVAAVKALIGPNQNVLLVLDSKHTCEHVLAELEAYTPLIQPGSYAVAMDGHVMETSARSPRAGAEWTTDNPNAAVREFARRNPDFVVERAPLLFNESVLTEPVTGWRGGLLKRIR